MIINRTIKFSILFIALLLSACDSFRSDSLRQICDDSPELCNDLHQIDDCRFKRTDVIRARYFDKIEPSGLHQRQLLDRLVEYESCLELTLFIEYTRNKQRKVQRVDNFFKTQQLIKEELQDSKGTQDPRLAYYLWTHYKDEQARKVFLAAARKDDVSDPELVFNLAIMNAKTNPQRSLTTFYKALVISDSLEHIPLSTYVYIMNIFYQHKQYENAYIWALIAKKEDKEDNYPINFELILGKGMLSKGILIDNDEELQEQADTYYKKLQDGNFTAHAPQLPRRK